MKKFLRPAVGVGVAALAANVGMFIEVCLAAFDRHSAFHVEGIFGIMLAALVLGGIAAAALQRVKPEWKRACAWLWLGNLLLFWTIMVFGNAFFSCFTDYVYGKDTRSILPLQTFREWKENGLYMPLLEHLTLFLPYGFAISCIPADRLRFLKKLWMLLGLMLVFSLLWVFAARKMVTMDYLFLWFAGGLIGMGASKLLATVQKRIFC